MMNALIKLIQKYNMFAINAIYQLNKMTIKLTKNYRKNYKNNKQIRKCKKIKRNNKLKICLKNSN